MRKVTDKQRLRDVNLNLRLRLGAKKSVKKYDYWLREARKIDDKWLEDEIKNGLNAQVLSNGRVVLKLPDYMNFSDNYEDSIKYIHAIRRLSQGDRSPTRHAYRLASVNFDSLIKISSSAALVLTAELSRWDDSIRKRLKPNTKRWDVDIVEQFCELGFFELFGRSHVENRKCSSLDGSLRFVKYIKGRCGDSAKIRVLRESIEDIIEKEKIEKWSILRGGLDEAITNVSHHAYPGSSVKDSDKNWYLTGSYNKHNQELKVVFYDQGVGIPGSLPSSEFMEKIYSKIASWNIPVAERKNDELLLKAAVEMDRTSTGLSDRGKGLQDLLEFIRQRRNGYLSIMSGKALYKYSMSNGSEDSRTERFYREVQGTLIVWSVNL